MDNRTLQQKFKEYIKHCVYATPLFRWLLISIYELSGRKPWSIGYSIYKFDQIKDTIENHMDIFLDNRLPKNYGFGLDERVVEYPWVFSRLKTNELNILDAGSTLNHADILSLTQLKNRKLTISTLSYEGMPKGDNIPTYIFEDLRNTSFKNDSFDAITCISTLEHVGMDNSFLYAPDKNFNEGDQYAFLSAVKLRKKPDGLF